MRPWTTHRRKPSDYGQTHPFSHFMPTADHNVMSYVCFRLPSLSVSVRNAVSLKELQENVSEV